MFTSKKKKSFILDDGTYEAEITGAMETQAKSPDHNEATPQIEVDYLVQTEDGPRKIKQWYNLKGYQVDDDKEFIKDAKTGNRKADASRTQSAQDIFAGLAHDAGIAEGEDFDLEDLIGKSVGIVVGVNELGNKRVLRSMAASELA